MSFPISFGFLNPFSSRSRIAEEASGLRPREVAGQERSGSQQASNPQPNAQPNAHGSRQWRHRLFGGTNSPAPEVTWARVGLGHMPVEIVEEIARHLPYKDRTAVALTSRFFHSVFQQELFAANVPMRHAPKVNDLKSFTDLLEKIAVLPMRCRGEPLASLGARICRLPSAEQQPAINAFLDAASKVLTPIPPLLDELIRAAALGPEGLRNREFDALNNDSPARKAIRQGENLQEVVQRHGITDPIGIAILKGEASSRRIPSNPSVVVDFSRFMADIRQAPGLT